MKSAMLIERWTNMPIMPFVSIQSSFDGPWTGASGLADGAAEPASSVEPGLRPSETWVTGEGGVARLSAEAAFVSPGVEAGSSRVGAGVSAAKELVGVAAEAAFAA